MQRPKWQVFLYECIIYTGYKYNIDKYKQIHAFAYDFITKSLQKQYGYNLCIGAQHFPWNQDSELFGVQMFCAIWFVESNKPCGKRSSVIIHNSVYS